MTIAMHRDEPFTVWVYAPDKTRPPRGKKVNGELIDHEPIAQFEYTPSDRVSLDDMLKAIVPRPEHLTYASWVDDGMYYDIVHDNWALEPHGHERGPSLDPIADIRRNIKSKQARIIEIQNEIEIDKAALRRIMGE